MSPKMLTVKLQTKIPTAKSSIKFSYFQLQIYIICIYIIGCTVAVPVNEELYHPSREIVTITEDNPVTITEDNPGLASRDVEKIYRPREIIFEIIETKDAAQRKDVLVIDEIVDAPAFDNDDMELAETHLFRPLFRYRAQLERRQRLQQSIV